MKGLVVYKYEVVARTYSPYWDIRPAFSEAITS
jgi:hypothetical protein